MKCAMNDFIEMCMEAYLSFELITPEIALEMLKSNTNNYRELSDAVVRRYVKDLESGLWTCTTASIAFTANGVLVDGQHRLNAIVQSGKSVYMFVMRGLPEEFADDPNQDKGKMRTVAKYLEKIGVKQTTTVTGALRAIYRIASNASLEKRGRTSLTDAQVVKVTDFMPVVFFDSVHSACNSVSKKIYSPSVTAAFFYLCARHDPVAADLFIEIYLKRTEASSTHPANVLREQVSSNKKLISDDKFFGLAFSAFNSVLRGETRKLLRCHGDLQIPTGAKKALAEFLEILNG
jgi:hypothetical protein